MKKLMISLLAGLCIALVISTHFTKVESSIANSVVRLHIIAQSDSECDQMLKLKVRDAITKNTKDIFTEDKSIYNAKKTIVDNIENIKNIAEKEIKQNGFDYKVNVTFEKSEFPTKIYNNITLPTGSYDALKVEIGSAKGKNWWCVMFPPLCFIDGSTGTLDDESLNYLKKSLTKEEYNLVSLQKDVPVKIEFKIYELWQNGKLKLKNMFAK